MLRLRSFWVIQYFLMFYFQWMCGATMAFPPVPPTVVIGDDYGGYVSVYNARYQQYLQSKAKVILSGDCESACTRFMKLPNACATPNARFMFHAIRDLRDRVMVADSIRDSYVNESPAAFALQDKYKVWHFNTVKARKLPKTVTVEPGVEIVYTETDRPHLYQKWLRVKATRFVPPC